MCQLNHRVELFHTDERLAEGSAPPDELVLMNVTSGFVRRSLVLKW